MSNLMIRNFDVVLKRQLRIQAAEHGHSMEEEARLILAEALSRKRNTSSKLADVIHRRFGSSDGVELPDIKREALREPPDFSS